MNILHVLRTPVGGLFRHVCDLAGEQKARGHRVGAIYDSSTSDALSHARLAALAETCALGVHPVAMSRALSHRDIGGLQATRQLAHALDADVLHGHGAKGGAFVRLATGLETGIVSGRRRAALPWRTFYTPHGGSLHYDPRSAAGRVYLGLERLLERWTDGIVFESAYSAAAYGLKVGTPQCAIRIVPNGLQPREFEPRAIAPDAADFVFVGELRHLKGVDVLLEALSRLPATTTAVIVGAGPDAARFQALAVSLGLGARVRFPGALPARQAFTLGRTLIMPSRAESFPYVVLEAAAACLPMIATAVGGIPEILDGSGVEMVEPADVAALTQAMAASLAAPEAMEQAAERLRACVAGRFTIERMTDAVLGFYGAGARAVATRQVSRASAL